MNTEESASTTDQDRNARRARVVSSGDVFIGLGGALCVLAVIVGALMSFNGGTPMAFGGVIAGLLLVAVGYLKRIAAALVEQL